MICLDTNVVIGALNQRKPTVVTRLDAELEHGTRIGLSTVVLFELRSGIAKSQQPERNTSILEEFLGAKIEVLPFDAADASEAGDIRARLERAGSPIGPYDTLIAAQARRRGAVLITANRREFERVPGLMVQDWSA